MDIYLFHWVCFDLNTSLAFLRVLVTINMAKFSMSVPEAMKEALDREREERMLNTLQETIRAIIGDYFKAQKR